MQVLASMLAFGLIAYCLLDLFRTPKGAVRTMPRPFWVLVVLFFPLLGPLAWLTFGRPLGSGITPGSPPSEQRPSGGPQRGPSRGPVGGRNTGSHPPRRSAPRGPDDDPDFLRRLDDQLRRGRREGPGDVR